MPPFIELHNAITGKPLTINVNAIVMFYDNCVHIKDAKIRVTETYGEIAEILGL